MTIWIRGGRIVDSARGVTQKRDIVVERGRISRILKAGAFKEKGPKLRTINASGKIITRSY